jgi:hypothetical protein
VGCTNTISLQIGDSCARPILCHPTCSAPLRAGQKHRMTDVSGWLQAVVTNPVGKEWLERIREAHPAAFETWFTQRQYETGGEEGSGGSL